jgi:phosphatidylglycerol---prolipoprotein diacylglyceryl transferase
MIPFIRPAPIDLGLVDIHVFGILLATGVLLGSYLARRFADRHQMDDETLRWLGIRLIVIGFASAVVLDNLLYLKELRPWEWKIGISSYGGIIGGFAGFVFVTRPLHGMNRLRWADLFTSGLVPGFMLGRVGCSLAHDHVGVATDFPLAVNYPEGAIRGVAGLHHNLGLYEVPLVLLIWVFILLIGRIPDRKDGLISAFAAISYSVPRFFLDFLRPESSDPTYLGLTPGHYFSIVLLSVGLAILHRLYIKKEFTLATVQDTYQHPVRGRAEAGTAAARPAGKPASRAGKKGSGKKSKKR